MEKLKRLQKNDKVAIVSLSSGILGESFVKHELDLGEKRLKEFRLVPVYMKNALKGLDFIATHPEARAEDLIEAFEDPEIKAIICAIGGIDAYKTFPYLVGNQRLKFAVQNNPKIFLSYSDSTNHHLILNNLGLNTFYGQAFITDLAEFENDMLPYSKEHFEMLFEPKQTYEIKPSKVWYADRTSYKPEDVGTNRISYPNQGYEVLQGTGKVQGYLYGGCLDVLAYHIGVFCKDHEKPEDLALKKEYILDYPVLPNVSNWNDNTLLFIETSDEKMSPEDYRKIVKKLTSFSFFDKIKGILCGKPIDEVYYNEYKQILIEELKPYNIPVFFNVNFGHSYPHAIIPFGALAELDADNKTIKILDNIIE